MSHVAVLDQREHRRGRRRQCSSPARRSVPRPPRRGQRVVVKLVVEPDAPDHQRHVFVIDLDVVNVLLTLRVRRRRRRVLLRGE